MVIYTERMSYTLTPEMKVPDSNQLFQGTTFNPDDKSTRKRLKHTKKKYLKQLRGEYKAYHLKKCKSMKMHEWHILRAMSMCAQYNDEIAAVIEPLQDTDIYQPKVDSPNKLKDPWAPPATPEKMAPPLIV